MKTITFDFSTEAISHREALTYFAIRLTRNKEEAEDLLQETLLKAFSNKDKFTDHSNLKAWMFTIMKNIFINHYRKGTKMKMVFDSSKESFLLNMKESKTSYSPESRVNYQQIQEFIARLDPDFNRPLTMYFEGFKYKEIAEEMDLPIGTIKSRIFVARKQLAGQLQEFVV